MGLFSSKYKGGAKKHDGEWSWWCECGARCNSRHRTRTQFGALRGLARHQQNEHGYS